MLELNGLLRFDEGIRGAGGGFGVLFVGKFLRGLAGFLNYFRSFELGGLDEMRALGRQRRGGWRFLPRA